MNIIYLDNKAHPTGLQLVTARQPISKARTIRHQSQPSYFKESHGPWYKQEITCVLGARASLLHIEKELPKKQVTP